MTLKALFPPDWIHSRNFRLNQSKRYSSSGHCNYKLYEDIQQGSIINNMYRKLSKWILTFLIQWKQRKSYGSNSNWNKVTPGLPQQRSLAISLWQQWHLWQSPLREPYIFRIIKSISEQKRSQTSKTNCKTAVETAQHHYSGISSDVHYDLYMTKIINQVLILLGIMQITSRYIKNHRKEHGLLSTCKVFNTLNPVSPFEISDLCTTSINIE